MLPSIIGSSRSLLLQVCRPGLSAARALTQPARHHIRSFASLVDSPAPVAALQGPVPAGTDGRQRPHLGIEVNPNHGLFAFFRKEVDDSGGVTYKTVEPTDIANMHSGRSWLAPELRRKSSKDLHILWYILLRERNLLATQKEEMRRMTGRIANEMLTRRAFRVRKSMARIKYVLDERRRAYAVVAQSWEEKRTVLLLKDEQKAKAAALRAAKAEKAAAKARVARATRLDAIADAFAAARAARAKARTRAVTVNARAKTSARVRARPRARVVATPEPVKTAPTPRPKPVKRRPGEEAALRGLFGHRAVDGTQGASSQPRGKSA